MSATQSNNIYNSSGTVSNSGTVVINGTTQSNILTLSSSGNIGIGNSTSGQVLTVSGTGSTTWYSPKTTYHILGDDFEVESSYSDGNVSMIIATLNVLKEPYWRELKKQNVSLGEDMEKFIENQLLKIRREDSIDKIVGTNSKT